MTEYTNRTIFARGLAAAVLAAVLNAALVPITRSLDLATGFEPISYPTVVFLTVLAALAATAVFGLVVRLSARPARMFTALAAVVLVMSFLPDLLLLGVDPAATVLGVFVLMLMHVVAAVVIVGILTRGVGSIL